MDSASVCPGVEDLRRFLLGQVSDLEIEETERHLAGCPSCLQTVQGLDAEDTLVEALQAQAEALAIPPDIQVESMIRRLAGVAHATIDADTGVDIPSSAPANQPAPSEAGASESSFLDASTESYSFLQPPQQPDEMGRLGAYRVLDVLGTGGMGIVFRAEDPRLGRLIALKVMRLALIDSSSARHRFLREARAAAAVEHEHVVHINEVGEDHGIPYVSMPLLQGESLDTRIRRQGRLPVAEVLRIGRETAEGLRAAHERGLIHRDIKPANLWLEGERGRVKILDFGLARPAADGGQVTRRGFVVGTPAFMAPEQAEGGDIDTRADLFSLGCVLYRLVTGRLPFQGTTALQVLHALTSEEPAPPRQLNPEVPPDLEELVRGLLVKDPAGRLASAREVVEALAAIERGEPANGITSPTLPAPARPDPRRKVRRPRLRRIGLAGLFVVLVAGGCLYGPTLLRFVTNRGQLTVETDRDVLVVLHQGDQRVQTLRAEAPRSFDVAAGEYEIQIVETVGGGLLKSYQFRLPRGGRAVISASATTIAKKPASEERLALPMILRGVGTPACGVAFSPDGRLLAAAGGWKAKVWELATGKESVILEDELASFMSIVFRPDSKQLACGSTSSRARVWDIPSGQLLLKKHLRGEVKSLTYSPDGKRLVSSNLLFQAGGSTNVWGDVIAWDPGTGEETVIFAGEAEQVPVSVAYSPDGRQVAASMIRWEPAKGTVNVGDVRVWDACSGRRIHTLDSPAGPVSVVAYSPDGKHLAAGAHEGEVLIWEATKGRALASLQEERMGSVRAIAFSPNGRRLASGGVDRTVRIWDLDTGKPILALQGHGGTINAVAFSPDGRLVASAGDDGTVRVWDATRAP